MDAAAAGFHEEGVEGDGIEVGRLEQRLDLVGLEQTPLLAASHRGREIGHESGRFLVHFPLTPSR